MGAGPVFSFGAHLTHSRRLAVLFVLAAVLITATSCDRASNLTKEVAYVNASQVVLRDRLAPIFEKKGTVYLGEKVYILDHKLRFSLVRDIRGEVGWIADRYLIPSETYDQFKNLETDNANTPVIATGTVRVLTNLHLEPGRDTDHLFQLKQGDQVEILKRATAVRPLSPREIALKSTSAGKDTPPPTPQLEDWFLVRGPRDKRVGWALARFMDVNAPLDVAQYAEGKRIVTCDVLSEVKDGDQMKKQYLVALTDDKDGLPWDFNQIRIFTWNVKRHRYETAYRERNLVGFFPIMTGTQDFGGDGGVLPVFTIRVKDSQGNIVERKYRMIGPIVRRILSPAEQQKEDAEQAARRQHGRRSGR